MTNGGARAHSGPPPDPNALRRDRDKAEWFRLPAAGRAGDAPAWPLSKATARELELWAVEWRRPQAVMWEANGHVLEVALFVRSIKDAEKPSAPTTARVLVQRQMDALGLTEAGLRANRWLIEREPAATRTAAVSDEARSTARDRFRVVGDAG